MFYFCYGSNMLTRRLHARSPGACVRGTAILRGYALAFHKRGIDGSGKCSIVQADDRAGCVHGTLAEVPVHDQPPLHRAESLGTGYRIEQLVVEIGRRSVTARTFVATPDCIDDALRPFCWYKALVVHGAEQHQLPLEYIARIRGVTAVRDPDRARSAKHGLLLGRVVPSSFDDSHEA